MFILRKIFKIIGRIIAGLLVLLILIPAVFVALPLRGTSKDITPVGDTSIKNTVTENNGETYPYIFVHGMLGFGENSKMSLAFPYWGMSKDVDLLNYLRGEGVECYAPSVGPMSSAYDRACELYAQLTGTRVDYGEAHSKEFNHERYGRDYTGKALMGEPWDLKTKINLISHSFGGPTIRVLASLLAYGSTAEVEASGENCSELFKGGHADCVNAVITLASPSNGSPVANLMSDTWAAYLATIAMNVLSDDKSAMDPMLEQFGVTEKLDLLNDLKLAYSKDHCGYDMTINGSQELNKKYPTADTIYYISYSADLDNGVISKDESSGGKAKILVIGQKINKFLTNVPVDGKLLGSDWAPNDGLVPVVSAQYPLTDEDNYAMYEEGIEIKRGVWAVMPTDGGSHGYYTASATEGALYAFYDKLIPLVNGLK